jgi:hypothetical protein
MLPHIQKAILILVLSISILFSAHNILSVNGIPALKDPKLKLQLIAKGLNSPTSLAFLAKDDMLVLEKDGLVRRILGNNTL